MKYLKISLVVLVGLAITSWITLVSPTTYAAVSQGQTTTQSTALERGYRTGYSDGYNAGYRDVADHSARDYQNKDEYQRGDRNYNEAWGTVENYRDGYQQGFEAGYGAGYDRRLFDSSIPAGLGPRGTVDSGPASVDNLPDNNTSPPNTTTQNNTNSQTTTQPAPAGGPLYIPRDTVLTIELESPLSTDVSQRGDRFQARVIAPQEFQGAIVEGRVTNVKRAGKVKGSSQLQLSFESIRMDNQTTGFGATVVEVVDMGNRDGAATVDSEGGVRGRDSTRDDISKVGASTGIGAIIGAVVGGGKGAAIGAAIGGTMGAGSVLSNRGKDVRLDRGQQLKIRAATEARIQ